MRKSAVLVAAGAFFLTIALLMKFYAYDRLAVVPLDQNTQQTVLDQRATFFDADNVRAGGGTLTTKVTVIGDPAASERASEQTGRDLGVYTKGQVSDNNGQAPPMDASRQTFVIDRFTGAAVNCCGESADGQPAKFSGQIIKFPFNTQKKSYDYWDNTAKKPMAMKFVGEETIRGLKTYKFTGSLPMAKFREQEVPRGLFGLPDTGAVRADRSYTNDRTLWVEPETGVLIKVQENQRQQLTLNEPGARPVNALTTNSVMTDATVQNNVDEYASKARMLGAVRTWVPWLLGLLGLVLLLGGVLLSLRGRGRDADGYDETDPDGYRDDTDRYDDNDAFFGDQRDGTPVAGGRVERRQTGDDAS